MGCKILILAEHEGGAIRDTTYELLGLAHRLAGEAGWNPAAEVKALIVGRGIDPLAAQVAERGAAEVVFAEGSAVEHYTGDTHGRAIEAVVKEEAPQMLLFGHTPNGWDVAPIVAAGLGVPVATDCSGIVFADGRPQFTRKVFNGKFIQVVEFGEGRPMIATMQKGAASPFTGRTSGTVRKVAAATAAEPRARFVEIRKGEAGAVDLTQAPIIVAGGRGLGSSEKFAVIKDLAAALGGQVGASRPVTDMGWLPHEHQIGSSGVTVNPKLYVGCGISGAIQHIVGMRGAGYIVAINKDPDAPIFQVAHVGVVGDLFEIAPALTKAVKEARGQG